MPISTISFLIRLYESEPLEDGRCPVVLQISWRDDKPNVRRKRLGISCLPSEFDSETGLLRNTAWAASKINGELNAALTKANAIYREHFERKAWDYKVWAELFDLNEVQVTFDIFCEKVIAKLYSMNKAGT